MQEKRAFVFLLSTRAGGTGLNLTAADTVGGAASLLALDRVTHIFAQVILLDSDYSPAADLQASVALFRQQACKGERLIACFGVRRWLGLTGAGKTRPCA